jgi:hypothetical protein
VGDRQHGAGVLLQVLLEPEHRLGVQVVGGLVKQQQVRLLEQELAERDPAALTTGQLVHDRVGRRAAQRVHRLLELGVDVPGVAVVEIGLQLPHLREQGVVVRVRVGQLGRDLVEPVELGLGVADALLDVLQHRLALGQRRFLQQNPHRRTVRQPGVTVRRLVQPRHDLQHRGLAGAVRADHADLRPGQEVQGDVVEHDLVTVCLTDRAQRVDEFRHAEEPRPWRWPTPNREPAVIQAQAAFRSPDASTYGAVSPSSSSESRSSTAELSTCSTS